MLESISDAATASYVKVPHEDDARLARKAHRTRLKLIELIEEGDDVGAEELWRKHLTEAGKVADRHQRADPGRRPQLTISPI